MFQYAQLQAAFERLRFKDETALREVGLAKLTRAYDAYPILEDGSRLLVLLPRGMDPGSARQLNVQTAAQKVVVLAQRPTGLAKVWPNERDDAGKHEAEVAPVESQSVEAKDLDIEFVEE